MDLHRDLDHPKLGGDLLVEADGRDGAMNSYSRDVRASKRCCDRATILSWGRQARSCSFGGGIASGGS